MDLLVETVQVISQRVTFRVTIPDDYPMELPLYSTARAIVEAMVNNAELPPGFVIGIEGAEDEKYLQNVVTHVARELRESEEDSEVQENVG